jgi:hypothetical protein
VPEDKREGGFFIPEPYLELVGAASNRAVTFSVTEFSRWIKELFLAARIAKITRTAPAEEGNHVLSSELFEELTASRWVMPGPPMSEDDPQLVLCGYALSWTVHPPVAGVEHPIISHPGVLPRFGEQVDLLFNDNFGIVVFANVAGSSNLIGDIIRLDLIARRSGMDEQNKDHFVGLLRPRQPFDAKPEETDQSELSATGPTQLPSSEQERISPPPKVRYPRPTPIAAWRL